MLTVILNKILIMFLFMACLNTIRHTYYFIQSLFPSIEDEPTKYRLRNTSLVLLGISVAYILTVIFTGIKL
jgi:hypothetical protein